MRSIIILSVIIAVSGCSWIGRQADALGEHMPVIGERCEHWQCMTSSGQARSDAYKAEEQADDAAKKSSGPPAHEPQATPTPPQ